ncbi:hypothetical protein ES703_61365 [subsurface metagenome]
MLIEAILKLISQRLVQLGIAGVTGWNMLHVSNLTIISRLSGKMMEEG